ncbi:S53 family peptidase [Roseateles koreensis]|uniref:S53 family peptidase n=1 Tax=Roseateles koreensis TaxID=2987526 RepID=A0ABT5KVT7_9BURK|nr:S53 family peptidase [Roseateles koreensis]MDC8786488.1 S53 family peptidase [Roseateles koreensis]
MHDLSQQNGHEHQGLPTAKPARSGVAPLIGCLTALALACSGAYGGQLKPHSVRSDAADVLATPTANAVFGCELRSFTGTRLPCYGPSAIRKAYGMDQLINAGYDGSGQTIVIIDAYGSPTLQADLDAFDAAFGLPPPPSLQQITMPGTLPFNYSDSNQLGWAEETSLDVQWAHAIAPGAKIVVVVAASNNDADILAAQNYAINNKLGHIISESFGESELALLQDSAGRKSLADNEASYRRAIDRKISVLVSAGDSGASSYDINGVTQPKPVAEYPASSPNVTSVGGTNLFFGSTTNADPNGSYQGEVVWNDGYGAGGGGISAAFRLPDYQEDALPRAIRSQLKGHRGYPDVAYNAGVFGGVIVRLGFLGSSNGFYIFGGTSASAPQWAGITAVANQVRHKPLGFLNKKLYKLGQRGALANVTHDVTVGDNSFDGVTGYTAGTGWDLATGWGTPSAGLVNALTRRHGGDGDDDDDGDND